MEALFSKAGERRLDQIVQRGMLCAFDFDGTLAPIVERPESVHLPPDIMHRLGTLSLYAPIAIITGRSIHDMKKYLRFSPDFLIGNHGLEGLPGWGRHARTYAKQCQEWANRIALALQDPAYAGVWIEDKRYSLSVHYRTSPDPNAVRPQLENLLQQLTPAPRIVSGKYVFNLVPQKSTDKGGALAHLMLARDFRSAIYVGDDVTDEDVFRLRRPDILSIRVEQTADSAAEFFLQKRQDMVRLLDELIRRFCALEQQGTLAKSAHSD
jgi:trehalose 6-phosphate phosphatase